jgi:hypothetical protein
MEHDESIDQGSRWSSCETDDERRSAKGLDVDSLEADEDPESDDSNNTKFEAFSPRPSSQTPLKLRPASRIGPVYKNDDEDPHYDQFTDLESEGELDPEEEAGHIADSPDPAWKSYDAEMEVLYKSLGRTLPFLRFTRTLEAAGYGEVELPGHFSGDLDGHIHPVFQQANWIREHRFGKGNLNENDVLWKRLQPSLRLATKLIQHPDLQSWWVRTLYGKQIKHQGTGRTYISDPPDRVTPAQGRQGVARRFDTLVGRVRWCFMSIKSVTPGHQTHGLLVRDMRTLDQHNQDRKRQKPAHVEPPRALYIALHENFRRFLLSPRYDKNNTPCKNLRMAWFLAFATVHELAHVFYASKAAIPAFKEPRFDWSDSQSELGWSWERSVLGRGEMQAYVDQDYGILSHQWSPNCVSKEEPLIDFDSLFRYPIPPAYMYKFFTLDAWKRFESSSAAEKATFWHPPEGRHALTSGPRCRGGPRNWIWVTQDYPPTHRLSQRYWELKNEDWMKRSVYKAKMDRAKKKTSVEDKPYAPGKRRSRPKPTKDAIVG